jgi:DNA-binding NarL/FixJ family response regulator
MEVDAMAMEPTAFGCLDAEPRVRRALIFHERVVIATALSTSIQRVQRVGVIDCFDDGFALADGYGQRPADLVLVGYRTGSGAAGAATDLLLSLFPDAAVIAFGDPDATRLLVTAVIRGARGILLWSPLDPVPGRHPGAPTPEPRRRAGEGKPGSALTARERDILSRVAQGGTNPEIARALTVSEDTVKTQLRRIYRSLGARDRAHAVALGMRLKYLS